MTRREKNLRLASFGARSGAAALCIALCLPVTNGLANPTYMSFGVTGAKVTQPSAINSRGTVAGTYSSDSSTHGFVRSSGGTITTFDPKRATNTYAFDINDSGAIDGSWLDKRGVQHGFVRHRKGRFTTFDPPGSVATEAEGMNANGDITGSYEDSSVTGHGFIRSGTDGSISTFDVPGAKATLPVGINVSKTVSGYYRDSNGALHGFVRTSGGTVTSFDPPGSISTAAWSINDSGVIAGIYTDAADMTHGFVRAADGTITTFDPTASVGTYPGFFGLDANGDITGSYYFKNSQGNEVENAFIRTADGRITTYHYPKFKSLTTGEGINTSGAATGWYAQTRTVIDGYIRTP